MKQIIIITAILISGAAASTPMIKFPPADYRHTGQFSARTDTLETCGCSHYTVHALLTIDYTFQGAENVIDLIALGMPLPETKLRKIIFDREGLREWTAWTGIYIDSFVVDCYQKPLKRERI